MNHRIRIGTRGSALARWQAEWTAARLTEAGYHVDLVWITTQGDAQAAPIGNLVGQIGGQGVFTKEIQQALLREEVDVAVHSLKDLPTESITGLAVAAVPPRESTRDVLISRDGHDLASLPHGATVGTGSRRRAAQLLYHRGDLRPCDVRGNVDTRLRKLDEGEYDALLLAEAGLLRLGLTDRITQLLAPPIMYPAVGQGALALEVRENDHAIATAVSVLNDAPSYFSTAAERALLRTLRAGCMAPVGAWGRIQQGKLLLDAVVLSHDGVERLTASAESVAAGIQQAEALGVQAAQQLLTAGAEPLIAASR